LARQTSSVSASTTETKRAIWSSAGGLCAGACCVCGAPPPLISPRIVQRVDAEDPAGDQRDRHRADADAAAAQAESSTTTATAVAHVLDVLTLAVAFPSHCSSPGRRVLRVPATGVPDAVSR
jgi:hypothetical protein